MSTSTLDKRRKQFKLKTLRVHYCVFFRPDIKREVQRALINRAFVKYKDLHDGAKKYSQIKWREETN